MRQFYRLTLLLLGSGGLKAYAQDAGPPVTGRFERVGVEELARQLEAQTRYRFFFDSTQVRGAVVSVTAQGQPLADVLQLALTPAGLRVSLDAEHHVFIYKGELLNLALPSGPGQPGATAGAAPAPAPVAAAPATAAVARAGSAAKVVEIGRAGGASHGRAVLTGVVRDARTGEPVIGASVYVEAPAVGTATDQFGAYALTLPVGPYVLHVRGVGLAPAQRRLVLHADGRLDLEVSEALTSLREVVVEGNKDRNVASTQMGVERLDLKAIKQVPTVFGEADVLRVVLTLPGVKSVGESSTGLSVRGGNTDQNLLLLNDAVVYSPSHLFGFFSAFNPDLVKAVELYKSAIPARYGGRLSSVLDISTREGNRKKFGASGGIGALTSRLTLEGPLGRPGPDGAAAKGAWVLGGRASYSDWLLHLVPDRSLRQSAASFYDVTSHLNYDLNPNNALYATGYVSRDYFKLSADTSYTYHNLAGSLRWKHTFGPRLYGVFTATGSRYSYHIASERNNVTASTLSFGIAQVGGQADFTFYQGVHHTLDFGASSLRYFTEPGTLAPLGGESLVRPDALPREQAQESALYASDLWHLSPRLDLSLGLRYSLYQALGPRDVNQYLAGRPRTEGTLTDTVHYGAGQAVATYHGPEPRVSLRYALSERTSLKASYNRTRQYLHQLSNTTAVSPADTWKLSDAYVRPQLGDQVSLGFYRNFRGHTLETSVEVYYKKLRDFVDYTSGAVLLLNHHLETDLVNAEGRAYGVEVSVRKTAGKLNGWLSYTYARSLVRVPTGAATELINGGNWYPSNFDKPHDVSLAGNYRFSRRISFSFNFVYSTGRPITLPVALYDYGGVPRVLYSDRNQYRIPDYYRADVGLNLEGSHKVRKLGHSSWTLSIYNLTGRHNPYSVYFKSQNGRIDGYQLSVFARPIPTVTYNFRLQ